jgi:hypothetical protein
MCTGSAVKISKFSEYRGVESSGHYSVMFQNSFDTVINEIGFIGPMSNSL